MNGYGQFIKILFSLTLSLMMVAMAACADQNQFEVASGITTTDTATDSRTRAQSPTPMATSKQSLASPGNVDSATGQPAGGTATNSEPSRNRPRSTTTRILPVQIARTGTLIRPLDNQTAATLSGNPPVLQIPSMKYKLAWEERSRSPWTLQTKNWSEYIYKLIKNDLGNELMGGAADMEKFCPKYSTLDNELRINFWAALISSITKFESSYDPTTSVIETNMGIDPITGVKVRSEGLMQLSYQDTTGWNFCQFNWEKDKALALKDPRKTILDPYKNLDCGARILAQQIKTKNRITMSNNVYWAVLKIGGKFEKIDEIAEMTKKLVPPCH